MARILVAYHSRYGKHSEDGGGSGRGREIRRS